MMTIGPTLLLPVYAGLAMFSLCHQQQQEVSVIWSTANRQPTMCVRVGGLLQRRFLLLVVGRKRGRGGGGALEVDVGLCDCTGAVRIVQVTDQRVEFGLHDGKSRCAVVVIVVVDQQDVIILVLAAGSGHSSDGSATANTTTQSLARSFLLGRCQSRPFAGNQVLVLVVVVVVSIAKSMRKVNAKSRRDATQ
jgi:hypothetical protein